jgi:membrane fusion protein, macrolide-specific efflux system
MRVSRRPSMIVNGTLAVLALAGAGLAYRTVAVSNSTSTTAAGTRTATVSTGAVTATVSATGSLASASTANANFVTSGTVTEIDVKVGQGVKKGQVLAKVDPTAAKEQLTTAEANLTAAQDALDRAQAATTSDDATISSAQAQVTSAQETVDSDERAVAGTVLTAPMAGTVTAINGSVGGSSSGSSSSSSSSSNGSSSGSTTPSSNSSSSSSTSTGFVAIADLTKMQAGASFAEADATKLKVGQAATVTWSALTSATATGKVATIAPTATTTNSVNSYAVEVSLSTLPAGVRIGQTLSVVVTIGSVENVLRVPLAAVRTSGSRHTVQVKANGQTQTVPVEVGLEGDSFYQITSGLTAGQQVVLTQTSTTTSSTGTNGFPGGGGGGLGGGGLGRGGGQ